VLRSRQLFPVPAQKLSIALCPSITIAELFWLRMLFKELKIFLSTPVLWCDHVSALAPTSNPVFHARTKHIELDYHFVREKVLN
jgi:hypothetical protein